MSNNQTSHLKYVQLVVCQLHLNETVEKGDIAYLPRDDRVF